MEITRSLQLRLLAGLAITLTAAAVYSAYTARQLRTLRQLQSETVGRNRSDSLLLLRIQNDLNALGLTMRDMLDSSEPYPLTAWQSQMNRIRDDLQDAIAREAGVAPPARTPDQARYLTSSMTQFADALDRVFDLARRDETEARAQIRLSLQARQAALSTAVSRLLVQNNESEEQAGALTAEVYARVERNLYLFLGAVLIVIAGTSAYLLHYNRRVLGQISALSQRRGELAQQLISSQESTLRSISRDLHDDFGQILTAIGIMLDRAGRHSGEIPDSLRAALREVQEIVQVTLEKVRTLSQALHPVMLEEMGLESALAAYIPGFEDRTGVTVHYEKSGASRTVDRDVAIHVYRVAQEALNNVARHSQCTEARVRLAIQPDSLRLEVEDSGVGLAHRSRGGMGLVSMRERAEMVKGSLELLDSPSGGALIRLTVPLSRQEAHATATN